jgi:hypothetical protein
MDATVNRYFDGRMHDRDYLIERYDRHVREVQESIAPDSLLTFNVKAGWQPLCDFLGVPVPDGPFPRVNDAGETREMIQYLMEHGFESVFPQEETE